jgi:putative transposase
MPKKRFSAEQIVMVLRQIEVLMAQGKATPEACREAGISQQSYYRWRKEYGGVAVEQAKRLKPRGTQLGCNELNASHET